MQGTVAAMHNPAFGRAEDSAALSYYKPLSDAASGTRLISRFIHSLPYAWQYAIGELVTNKGRLRHFYFRKKEIEKQARALLGAGEIKQVVILGAGLDVLALRLAKEYPAVKFIEIDTQESQAFKLAALRAASVAMPGNVECIEGDLRDPLPGILLRARLHDVGIPTLWIAEGFFMFIPEESVVRILHEIRQLSAPASPLVFTTLPAKKVTSAAGHCVQTLYLHKEKSPFQWTIPLPEVPKFMKNAGFSVREQIAYGALHKRYMGQKFDDNHAIGEDMHIATT